MLDGELTARGTTAPVAVVVTSVSPTATGLTVFATARVDRTAFGVTTMKGMVGRHLDLPFAVMAAD